MTALIIRVLHSAPDRSSTANTFNTTFTSEASAKPPNTLDKLYADFPDTNLTEVQGNYDILASIIYESAPNTLCSFADDPEYHCLLVYNAVSVQHLETRVQCITGL